jgi:hypothetical protein
MADAPTTRSVGAMILTPLAALLVAALTAAPAGATDTRLTEHVLQRHELQGVTAGDPVLQNRRAFAAAHDISPELLRRRGFVRGATAALSGAARGLSVAELLRTRADAAREARRLFAANAAPEEPGVTSTHFSIPGIPGLQATELAGQGMRGYEVVFARGRIVHELFVLGPEGGLSRADLANAITHLIQRLEASQRR